MSNLKITTETVYSITGLTFEDMEMLCLGLDAIRDSLSQPKRSRNVELTESIEDELPEVKSLPGIEVSDCGSP